MRRLSALVSILTESLSAPIAIATLFAVSVAAASETVNQGGSVSGLPHDPVSTTASSVSSNSFPLRLPDANDSLSLLDNFTASGQFHIPDSPINLDITVSGRPLGSTRVTEIVGLALDEVSTNLSVRPTESITNGFFRQRHRGLEIKVYQYVGQQVTWFLLDRVIHAILDHESQRYRPCELRFEIEVVGHRRVGYGSLWQVGPRGGDVAPRAVHEPLPPPLAIVSNPTPATLRHSTTTAVSDHILFSYHLFGPPMPEPVITICFDRARRSIRADVQDRPHEAIPDDSFVYSVDSIPIVLGVAAYAGKKISWLLLDRILRDVSADIVGRHQLRECSFEFEIDPFEEPLGHGYLEYSL